MDGSLHRLPLLRTMLLVVLVAGGCVDLRDTPKGTDPVLYKYLAALKAGLEEVDDKTGTVDLTSLEADVATLQTDLDAAEVTLAKIDLGAGVRYSSEFADLDAAITAISTDECFLVIDEVLAVDADETVPSTLRLVLVGSGGFSIATTKTLTIESVWGIVPAKRKIFTCAGTGKVVLTGTVYPEWWGAVGDGVTNDTTAVQACLSSGAARVEFSDKTYLIGQVAVKSNTDVCGCGWSTVIQTLSTEPDMALRGNNGTTGSPSACTNVHVHDLKIDGQGAARIAATLGGYVRGISFYDGSSNVSVYRCWVEDGGRRAVEFRWGCIDVKATDNYVTNTSVVASSEGDALHADYASRLLYSRNRIETWGDTALAATFSSYVQIVDNQIFGAEFFGGTPTSEESAVDINYCTHAIVANNLCYKIAYGFCWAGSLNYLGTDYISGQVKIIGNTCVFNSDNAPISHAIYIAGLAAGDSENIEIVGNYIENAGIGAIVLSNYINRFVIQGNTIINPQKNPSYGGGASGSSGIAVGGSAGNSVTNGTITGNLLSGDGDMGPGIYLNTGSEYVVCFGNTIIGAATLGIRDLGSNNVVDGFLKRDAVLAATSGTGEDTLKTITLPQNIQIRYNGIRVKAAGYKNGVNDTKTLKFYLGASSVTFVAAANDTHTWSFDAEILFGASNQQRVTWRGVSDTAYTQDYEIWTEDFGAGTVVMKVTGECAHASDSIYQGIWIVEVF